MSAAVQLPMVWAGRPVGPVLAEAFSPSLLTTAVHHTHKQPPPARTRQTPAETTQPGEKAVVSYAFYRKHTEKLLRRYLYASMQVGRSPSLLGESVGRGWVSSRPVRTFEDALIFVLDVERCLKKLTPGDRQIISRVVLQEYTHAEASVLLGISTRTICTKLPLALDCLTEWLVEADLLVLPD